MCVRIGKNGYECEEEEEMTKKIAVFIISMGIIFIATFSSATTPVKEVEITNPLVTTPEIGAEGYCVTYWIGGRSYTICF